MKKQLLASTSAALVTGLLAVNGAQAQENIKIGVILGFTGPLESITPDMANGAELAMKEVNDSGLLLDGAVLEPIRADSTCVDSAAATAAAERLVTSDGIAAFMGPDCSGVTTAVANNVAVPNGVPVVSPSATSPALTAIEDNGYFFRVAPSDARQGQILAEIVKERGIDSVAITYTNNDYGKGLADSFGGAYEALGGTIAISASHEDGKGDYSAEVGALAASGASDLVVLGYIDQGGKGIIQASLDTGAFERFILADGMIGESIFETVGEDIAGSFGTIPGSESDGAGRFLELAEAGGFNGDGPYRGESYDAAALIALAIQAGGSADRSSIKDNIMAVANAPGEPIQPGELAKALQILKDGGDVDYVGASNVELTDIGEASGSYKELEVEGAAFVTKSVR